MNRKLVIFAGASVAVVAVVVAIPFLMPRDNLLINHDSSITGWAESNETVNLHLTNVGQTTISIYRVTIGSGINSTGGIDTIEYTFLSDIVIPSGVDCWIRFKANGGKVNVETVKGSPEAHGGEQAFSTAVIEKPFNPTNRVIHAYTRSGSDFEILGNFIK